MYGGDSIDLNEDWSYTYADDDSYVYHGNHTEGNRPTETVSAAKEFFL